jgi:hypothetical protein
MWWLMTSTDTNAVRLLLLLMKQRRWQEDLPRLLSGALVRLRRHGAAPVWADIMAWLHRSTPSSPMAPPPGIIGRQVSFPSDIE